jgi:ABC-type dipeptide/oligopeptide/nickel transport system permease component
VFVIFNMVGGDPAYVLAGKISNQEQIDNIRKQLGVDQPYYVQLGIFVQAGRHRRLRRELEHQREDLEHPRDAPRSVADGAGSRS